MKGRKALKELLEVNKRLNTAYLLKESFSQLWRRLGAESINMNLIGVVLLLIVNQRTKKYLSVLLRG